MTIPLDFRNALSSGDCREFTLAIAGLRARHADPDYNQVCRLLVSEAIAQRDICFLSEMLLLCRDSLPWEADECLSAGFLSGLGLLAGHNASHAPDLIRATA